MNNKISHLIGFVGLCVVLMVGVSSAQDTLQLRGVIKGDNAPTIVEATPLPGYTVKGGGVKNTTTGFLYKDMSAAWCGTIHLSSQNGGFLYSPQDTVIDLMGKSLVLTFTMTDTARPEFTIFNPMPNAELKLGYQDSICISAADNSMRIGSFHYDYSTDDGATWDTLGNQSKTSPTEYFGVGTTTRPAPNQVFYFTPQKVSDNYKIRIIIQDFFHGLADTDYVSVKVADTTTTHIREKVIRTSKILNLDHIETFDLMGRKISAGSKLSMKCYAIRAAGLTKTQIRVK